MLQSARSTSCQKQMCKMVDRTRTTFLMRSLGRLVQKSGSGRAGCSPVARTAPTPAAVRQSGYPPLRHSSSPPSSALQYTTETRLDHHLVDNFKTARTTQLNSTPTCRKQPIWPTSQLEHKWNTRMNQTRAIFRPNSEHAGSLNEILHLRIYTVPTQIGVTCTYQVPSRRDPPCSLANDLQTTLRVRIRRPLPLCSARPRRRRGRPGRPAAATARCSAPPRA